MDLSIRHFMLLLLIGAIFALFFLEPYHVSVVRKKGLPQVLFENFEGYEITPEGVVSKIVGKVGKKFHSRLLVEEANLTRLGPRGVETVVAAVAVIDDAGVELKRRVRLIRSDGWDITTTRLAYDVKRKIYSTRGEPFVIRYGRSVVRGRDLRYDEKSGTIRAREIRAKIEEEDIR